MDHTVVETAWHGHALVVNAEVSLNCVKLLECAEELDVFRVEEHSQATDGYGDCLGRVRVLLSVDMDHDITLLVVVGLVLRVGDDDVGVNQVPHILGYDLALLGGLSHFLQAAWLEP